MKNLLQECIDIIQDLVGDEYLYFESAIEVKTSPHSLPFLAWGVCVSPDDDLFVMDNNQEWHQVKAEAANALLIGSLYQRLQLMRRKYAKAS